MHTFTRSKQMNRFHFITTLLLALSAFSPAWAADKLATLEIDNLNHPVENIYSSAQPAQASFKAIAESGIEVVVNLRPHSELDWDEQALVESLVAEGKKWGLTRLEVLVREKLGEEKTLN